MNLLDLGLDGSAAMVGKPVALVTVEKVIFDALGFDACKSVKYKTNLTIRSSIWNSIFKPNQVKFNFFTFIKIKFIY